MYTINNINYYNYTTARKIKKYKNITKQSLLKTQSGLAGDSVVFTRRKIPQFRQNIIFKEASNIKEAMEFGQENFRIESYTGFREEDLDIINWINEGLVKINNKAKGTAHMPKEIIFKDEIDDAVGSMSSNGKFCLSRNSITRAKNLCTVIIEEILSCSKEQAEQITSSKKPDEIFGIIGDFVKEYPHYQEILGTYQSEFSPIYHEIGHLQHFKNISPETANAFNYGIGKTHNEKSLIKLFNNSYETKSKVSYYAAMTPFEFVAETYAKMCDGIELDNDIINLYKKLGGVMI